MQATVREARLESVKSRVAIFGLMAAWTALKSFIGTLGASLVLAIVFLLAGLVVFGLLRSVLHRSQHPPWAGKTAA